MGTKTQLEMETLDASMASAAHVETATPLLTVLGHPDAARVGEVAWLPALARLGGRVAVNRLEPGFGSLVGDDAVPLASPFVSRKPLELRRARADRINLDPGALSGKVRVGGRALEAPASLPLATLNDGVVIRLGRHVVLLLHQAPRPEDTQADALGMVGESAPIRRLRDEIRRLADAPGALLIRGQTGSGKELAAAALHAASRRSERAFVPVNMAAVPTSLAASALFGHVRGAFSGAREAKEGYFQAADGGTLFLDEVGDTPDDVQAALLRVLETGEVQAVGASTPKKVDVRLLAATDADLEEAIGDKRFRAPLYYRLATHELWLPRLAERRDDIGRLLIHFLRADLEAMGRQKLLRPAPTEKAVWLSADVVERLALHAWPGNVRELRNVARYLASQSDDPRPLRADAPGLERLLGGAASKPSPSSTPSTAAPVQKKPSQITHDEVAEALEACDFKLGDAAKRLGISRPAFNELVDAHPTHKRALSLSDAEIEAGRAEAEATGRPLWQVLRVSKRGLVRRIREIDG